MSTDERMEKMEGQLGRIRWFNRCLIACIVLGLGVWFIEESGAEPPTFKFTGGEMDLQACATWLRHQGFFKPPTQTH